MTFNHEEALGSLVTRYKKNSERIGALDSAISEKRKAFESLCFELEHNLRDIEVADAGIRTGRRLIPKETFEELLEQLVERGELAKEKQELDACMKKAGLDGIIRHRS